MTKIMAFVVSFFIFFTSNVFANSSYVLPYPSTMPGSSFYKIHVVFEKLLKYWYFGSFGQFEYNLKESDKYLVEAKTLFEYNQYLLGYKALQESDRYFQQVKPYLIAAQKEGKLIAEKQKLLQEATQKHIEVLEKIKNNVPKTFYWQPEKSNATQLDLWKVINRSEELRKKEL